MIRLTEPCYGAEEEQAVREVLESTMLSPGTKVAEFEQAWASYVGTEYAVAVNSGTMALIGILHAMKRLAPDEPDRRWVLVPSFTCAPTVAAVINAGLQPAFVDSESETLGMDPDAVARAMDALGPRNVLAILPVHVYGMPFSKDLFGLARHYETEVIEDACEAHGATYGGTRKVGSFGYAGAFSFRGDKMITAGGVGGMVTTDDPILAEEIADARDLYLGPGSLRYRSASGAGWGSQMSNLQAAFGIAQIRMLPTIIEDRRYLAKAYGVDPQPGHVYWRLPMPTPRPETAAKIAAQHGIEVVPTFSPLHLQPIGEGWPWFASTGIAVGHADLSLCVPIHSGMTTDDVAEVKRCLAL